MTARPTFTSSAAALRVPGAAEAKAGKGRAVRVLEILPASGGPQTTRPASKPSAAALAGRAAVEAKAGEGSACTAPVTPPAPGAIPTARPKSTSPASVLSAEPGAKAGEEPIDCAAPVTRPASGEPQTTRTTSTPPVSADLTGGTGAKAGEAPPRRQTPAPVNRPAPYGIPTGPEALVTTSGPVTPSNESGEQQ